MAKRATEEFRRDAVRMALTGGLTRLQLSLEPDLKVVEQYQEIMIHRF
jgi:hypothetical protein